MKRKGAKSMQEETTTVTRDFTATTFVVDQGRTLLLLHRKLHKWFPPGGHIDPHELPHTAAIREVQEETGLHVALLGETIAMGEVLVLPQPHCILLEDITPDHQHIDLIYFARVIGGALQVAEREAQSVRWLSWEELAAPEIPVDICVLGRRAIEAMKQ
jgi:8-oxo-dGTP pyrophosphatase MutT (NUDIX family)